MKRNARQASSSTAASSTAKGPKRQKTSQACNSCRKSKTRCEILEDREKGTLRCHRCKVLGVHCSYQDMDKSELEESLRLPKVDKDVNKDMSSRNSPLARTIRWEQEAIRMVELANDSILLKTIAKETAEPKFMMWDFFHLPEGHTYDWSAPLETVRELAKFASDSESGSQQSTEKPRSVPNSSDSLTQILTNDQIQHLLDVFSQRYAPWLNFTLIRDTQNPTLDLVCCTVASRHLDKSIRPAIATRLQALTRDYCAKLIFQSRNSDSLEAIQCLLILSLWAPLCGNPEDFGDARTLIGSAVSMAMNCRLNEACDKALKLQTTKKKGEEVDESAVMDIMNKSRLWLAIANAESMLCIGSGRVALSKRNYEGYRHLFSMHQLFSSFPSDLTTGRDVRLRILAELCDAMETGLAVPFQSNSEDDIEKWYDDLVHVLQNMNRLLRFSVPLGVLADTEKFYHHMLVFLNKFLRLLLLYHALASCRMYQLGNQTGWERVWFREVRPRGVFLVSLWSKEAFQLSEAILVSLLEMDQSLLGTSPDYLFTMIAFAAAHALASNYLILRGLNMQVPGSTTKIIDRVIVHLMQASVSEDSPARKCAQLVSVMSALYETRRKELLATPRPCAMDILGIYNPLHGAGKKPDPQASKESSSDLPQRKNIWKILEQTAPDDTSSPSATQPVFSASPHPPTATAESSPGSLDFHSSSSSSQSNVMGTNPSSPSSPDMSVMQENPQPDLSSSSASLHSDQSSYQRPQSGTDIHNAYAGPSRIPMGRNFDSDVSMSNIDFGWIDNSLAQSTEFWDHFMVDMNLPGYPEFNLHAQGYPPLDKNSNFQQ
ncbi:hypothetical protein K435DRAFT_771725 [Dendrothele bispora CBS 962.96]|uniref:Zn(2)-C6 fungal-type domain-containing protein n=1 Tax=Dendrothele bispora (strain CBS 962.96) TaxID=1314807 RepID=A0A4S8MXM2_DENBC|nr:hypothetical protein K435DRAFT_771725 [Dendrothele bispora CBS 962.96]